MRKQLKKVISVFLAAVLCCSVYTVTLQAAPVKGYVKSATMKSKSTIVIPADKKSITKTAKVSVKVKGKVSKAIVAKSSNKAVATVKVKGNLLLVTAKKAGKAKIVVVTKGKNIKGKHVKKTLALTVKKAVKKPVKPVVPDPKQQEKAKEATDMENIRAAVTEVLSAYNTDGQPHSKSVPATQGQANWQDENCGKVTVQINGEEKTYMFAARTKADGAYVVFVWKDKDGMHLEIGGSSEVERFKEAWEMENILAAYEEVLAACNKDSQPHSKSVDAIQEQDGWQNVNCGKIPMQINGEEMTYMFPARTKADGAYVVTVSKGTDGAVLVIDGGSAAQKLEAQEKAKEATDMENIRAAVTEVLAAYNTDGQPHSKSVPATQEQELWQDVNCGRITVQINGEDMHYWFPARTTKDGDYVVTVSKGENGAVLVIDGGSAAQTLEAQEKAKEATDMENIRAAVTEVLAAYNKDGQPHSKSVPATQEQAGWQDADCGKVTVQLNGKEETYMFAAHTKDDGPYTVSVLQSPYGASLVIE